MRSLAILTVCAALGLTSCAGRLAAKPGVGIGVQHRPDGGRLGVDLGTYETEGAAIEPLTGNCPGGVCAVPGSEPTVSVPVSQVRAAQEAMSRGSGLPLGAWIALGVSALGVVALGAYVAFGARKVK